MPSNTFYIFAGNDAANNVNMPNNGSSNGSVNVTPNASKRGINPTLKSIGAMRLVSAGINTGRTIINYEINTYGLRTGETLEQENITQTINNIKESADIMSTAVSGAVVGGAAGAVIALSVGLMAKGTSLYLSNKTIKLNNAITNGEAKYQSQILGDILVGGSR